MHSPLSLALLLEMTKVAFLWSLSYSCSAESCQASFGYCLLVPLVVIIIMIININISITMNTIVPVDCGLKVFHLHDIKANGKRRSLNSFMEATVTCLLKISRRYERS